MCQPTGHYSAEKLFADICLENSEGATLVTSLEASPSVPVRSLTRSMAILFTKPRAQARLRIQRQLVKPVSVSSE